MEKPVSDNTGTTVLAILLGGIFYLLIGLQALANYEMVTIHSSFLTVAAYAVAWFSAAIQLLVVWALWYLKKKNDLPKLKAAMPKNNWGILMVVTSISLYLLGNMPLFAAIYAGVYLYIFHIQKSLDAPKEV